MVRKFVEKAMACVCAVALSAFAVMGLSGCSQVENTLGIVSNSNPAVDLQNTLPAGSTIEDGVLTVGVNTNNSPYAGTNSSNEVIGMDVDIAATLADTLGCKVKIVDVGSDGKTAVTDGTVDVALGAVKSGKSKDVTYSSAYINDGVSLFCLLKNMPESVKKADLSSGKVLVQASSNAANEIQAALGTEAVSATSTMKEAFDALEAGDATYLAADAVIGDYYARDYSDVVRVDFISAKNVSPVYAITSAKKTELSTAVNNAMDDVISNGLLRVVAAKWLGSQGSTLLPGALVIDSLPETFDPKRSSAKKTDAESSGSATATGSSNESEGAGSSGN